MEPRLIKGHIYKCKENVGKDYTKGHYYECEKETAYPDKDTSINSSKHMYGVITNNYGNTGHCWPYDPQHCPLCSDKWTDYFEDMGEKPAGMILIPFGVGDTVKWLCDDDRKVRRTKITGVNIEIDENGKMDYFYTGRIKFNGIMQNATIHLHGIARAENK